MFRIMIIESESIKIYSFKNIIKIKIWRIILDILPINESSYFKNNQIISETAYDHSNKLAYEKTTDSLTLYDFYKKPIKQKVYSKNLSSNSYEDLCEKFNKLKQKALTYVTNEIDISDKMPWQDAKLNRMTTREEFTKYIANKFNIKIE